MTEKTDYQRLREEFDAKVTALQESCPHKNKTWAEHWWAIGHSSGYKVLICDNCMKELAQNPPKEEREKQEKEARIKRAKQLLEGIKR